MSWTVAKLLQATGGDLLQGDRDRSVNRISTDTRTLLPDDCFVALPGENFDGHAFVPDALAKQVAAVIVGRRELGISFPQHVSVIAVADTLHALGELARYHRGQYAIPVVAITGSNGKTSTKEMIASILGKHFNVLKNKGNFNNLIGVPLTLLELQSHHQAAVVEMGINVSGEMQRLVEIGRPTVGLITNIHPAHLEGLHSLDRILQEKGKLFLGLGVEDLAVINLDDIRLRTFAGALKARSVTYSLTDASADVHPAGDIRSEAGMSLFDLSLGRETIAVRLAVLGLHQVQNALASAAVAYGMGESKETIAAGLAGHEPVRQRMQVQRLRNGTMLVDDTYNANPMSMLAAVRAVLAASGGSPCIAVLGEMRELGPESAGLHHGLGRDIGSLGLKQLLTLGDLAAQICEGAREAGMDSQSCLHARSHAEIVDWLRKHAQPGVWVLVKGSRGMTMERVVEGIVA